MRRTIADWTPDAGPLDDWLARWAREGWVPEHPWVGTETMIAGREFYRVPMVERYPQIASTATTTDPIAPD